MYLLKTTHEYAVSDNCTDNENNDIITIFGFLFLSIPSRVLLLGLFSLIVCTMIKPYDKKKFSNPQHP